MHHQPRSSLVRLILITATAFSCSKEESESAKSSKAFAAALNVSEQDKCNSQGKFYDNAGSFDGNTAQTCMNGVQTVTWPCTQEGLASRLSQRDTDGSLNYSDKSNLTDLDYRITDGYQIYQCGESKIASIYVIYIKEGMSSSSSSTDSTPQILIKGIRFSSSKYTEVLSVADGTKVKSNVCSEVKVKYGLQVGDKLITDFAPIENQSFSIEFPSDGDRLTTAFSDAACTQSANVMALKAGTTEASL